MELIKQHIIPHLNSFTNEPLSSLNNILEEIQNDSKTDKYTKIIHYFDKILNLSILSTNSDLTALHIHFEDDFDDTQKLLIAEYLSIKLFKFYHFNDKKNDDTNPLVSDFISQIESKLRSLTMKCPEGASGKNGGNRIWKNWVKEKKENRILLQFYKVLNTNSSLKPKSILTFKKLLLFTISEV